MMAPKAIKSLDYYENLASEDYYLEGGEPAGQWIGTGARLLGLNGQVETADYRNIFSGHGIDGKPLCNHLRNHQAGIDLCFSPPKSVSSIWARSDEDLRISIQQAQQRAVESAIKFAEQHCAQTRRGHNGTLIEPVAGFVAATFEHSTSRSVNNAIDYQLHTHCLLANVAPRLDGTTGTLHNRPVFNWQKSIGAQYRASLACQLRELGFSLEPNAKGDNFEVKGVPKDICAHFSKRTKAIEAELDKAGLHSSASKFGDVITVATRDRKTTIDRPALLAQWQQQLDEKGFTLEALNNIRAQESVQETTPLPVQSIVDELTEQHSTFKLQDLYYAAATQGLWHHCTPEDINFHVQQMIEAGDIIELNQRDHDQNIILATPEMIKIEQQLKAEIDQLKQATHFQLPANRIEAAIQHFENDAGYTLTEEQSTGVKAVCNSGIDILNGVAGGGKSTSMQVIKNVYEQTGFKVRGACVAKKAATQLEEETGIESVTIARLINDLESNCTHLRNTVLLVDEAGLLGSKALQQLTQAATEADAKIILVGEDKQLEAISHGGALRYFSEELGSARISKIQRQKQAWAREAVQSFRAGNALEALQAHQEHGLLHWCDSQNNAITQLVNNWHGYQLQNPDKEALILAQSWKQVQAISQQVRALRQAEGKVGFENVTLNCAVSDKQMEFTFSVGDRIKLTRNDHTKQLTNGTLGTITAIKTLADNSYRFSIEDENGKALHINTADYADKHGNSYFALGYALTVFSSQGSTINGNTFILHDDMMDRRHAYVAGSRHKDECHWFVDTSSIDANLESKQITQQQRLEALAHGLEQNNEAKLTLDYLKENERQEELEMI